MWDNIYPLNDWNLEDHKLLWKFVAEKILVFDVSIGGFVLTDVYFESLKTDCVICGDYMSDVEEEDYKSGCNNICDKC